MHRIFVISIAGRPVNINMYGGIESIVYYLSKEFLHLGFNVRVAAPEESVLPSEIDYIPTTPPIEADPGKIDWPTRAATAEKIYRQYMDDVDIVCDHSTYCYAYRYHNRVSHTLQSPNPWDCISVAGVHRNNPIYITPSEDLAAFYARFTARPYVIHHGIDVDLYSFKKSKSNYFLFLNRITHEKGAMDFVELCSDTGIKGVMVGSIVGDYGEKCAHYARSVGVEVKGHVSLSEKIKLLQNAKALIALPIPSYLEAWYLGATEAMACGTPVIALANGGLKEQITNGVNGFLCSSLDGVKQKVTSSDIDKIKPENCRMIAQTRFSAARMARNYVLLYSRLGWLR